MIAIIRFKDKDKAKAVQLSPRYEVYPADRSSCAEAGNGEMCAFFNVRNCMTLTHNVCLNNVMFKKVPNAKA